MVTISSFADRDVGRRDKLEDFVLHTEIETGGGLHLHVILVADGAGGGEAGELAARLTGRTIQDHLEVSEELIIPKLLIEAVEEANRIVYNELQGEGTSTVALAAVDLNDESEYGRLYIAHVGDSYICLMRDSQLIRLNVEHTIANEYYFAGQITANEAERLANGAYPSRIIGVNPDVPVDIGFYIEYGNPVVNAQRAFNIGRIGLVLHEGDSVFVASDGIFRTNEEQQVIVREDEILRHALDNDVENAVRSIIRYGASRNPDDNISLAMLFVPSRMRRAVLAQRLSRIQQIALGSILGVLLLTILFLGGQFLVSQEEQRVAQETQEYLAEVLIRLSATATFTPPPFTATPPLVRVDPNQIGWQFFGINSPLAPTPVFPDTQYRSSENSFVIAEGQNIEEVNDDFHAAAIFLIPDSSLEITFINNTFLQEHYEQLLYPPAGEFFANNHIFERAGSMVLSIPNRSDMVFNTRAYCVAAKHIPRFAESAQQEEERFAFTCFDGICNVQMPEDAPEPVIDLVAGQRYLFDVTNGRFISSSATIYEEVKAYYDLVFDLTGTYDEIECLKPYLDADLDGVPLPDDLCEFEVGTANGCPDIDGDGVGDIIDACPEEFGEANLDGCPPPILAADMPVTQTAAAAYGSETAAAIQATGTAILLQGSETAAALQATGTAILLQGSETAVALQATGTAAEVQGSETAAILQGTETAVGINGSETAIALQATLTAMGLNGSETAIALQSTETAAVFQITQTAAAQKTATVLAVTEAPTEVPTEVPTEAPTEVIPPPPPEEFVDLKVVKRVSPLAAGVDDTVTFTITVTNLGNLSASNVVINDVLPDGYTYVPPDPDNDNYNGTTWTVGNLSKSGNSGDSATLTFEATVTNTGNYTNQACFPDSSNIDNNSSNDCASAEVAVQTDLQVEKAVVPSNAHIGDPVTFTITVTNLGEITSESVDITDVLPDGYTYVNHTGGATNSYDAASKTITWNVDPLTANGTAGDSVTLTIEATVTDTDNYTNLVCFPDSNNIDNNPANDCASVGVTVNSLLSINKKVGANDGTNITFIITVTNPGPSDANNITVSDLLPNGYVFVSATASHGGYNSGSGSWDGATFDLAPNESATLTINATIDTVNGTNFTNTACLTEPIDFIPPVNNIDNCDTANNDISDLAVTKAISATDATNVGDPVTFTVTVTNNGPSPATNVTISDAVPGSYTFDTSNASPGNYNSTTGIWTIGNLGVSEVATLTIDATVIGTSNFTNTACVAGLNQFDNVSANNCATAAPNGPDLVVTKVETSSAADIGETVAFTITVNNIGGGDASNITISEILPDGYDNVNIPVPGTNPSLGTYNTVNNTWTIPTLVAGGSATLNIEMDVQAPTLDESTYDPDTFNINTFYNNRACVTALTETDVNSSNDCGEATHTRPPVNLTINKIVDPLSAAPGDTVTFSITVTNGPSTTTDIVIEDVLPAGYTYVSDDGVAGAAYNEATGIWYISTLAPNANITLEIVATVNDANNLNDYTNSACIIDSYESNTNTTKCASAVITVPTADLYVYKYVWPNFATVGDYAYFYIDVYNSGPNDATNVIINDLLPAGFTITYTYPYQGTYDPVTGVWNVGDLSSFYWASLYIEARIVGTTSLNGYTNTACATLDQFDNNTDNNCATVTVTVSGSDLSVEKTVAPSSADSGATVTFTVTVTNNGPDNTDATNIYIYDYLPDGYSYISHIASQGDYTPGSGYWYVGNLAIDSSAELAIEVMVLDTGNYTNTACVNYLDQLDYYYDNNCGTASITLNAALLVESALIPFVALPTDTLTPTPTLTAVPTITPLPPPLDPIKISPTVSLTPSMTPEPTEQIKDTLTPES
jgi:uncharacterized repeat protein (TIGR01451 family)